MGSSKRTEQSRDAFLTVRLSPALKASIAARAATVGVGEVSTYLMGLVAQDMREGSFPLGPAERMELGFAMLATIQADIRDGSLRIHQEKKQPKHT